MKLRNFWSNTKASAVQVGAIFGLLITAVAGAYIIPTAIETLINVTEANPTTAASPVGPLITIVGPIIVGIGFIVLIAKSADIM